MVTSKVKNLRLLIESLWQEQATEAFSNTGDIGRQADYRQDFIQQLKDDEFVSTEGDLLLPDSFQFEELWPFYRGLVNLRKPIPLNKEYLDAEENVLSDLAEAPATIDDASKSTIDSRLYLWQGDITNLAVDGIVNAANKDALGCFIPNHNCIDNIIHTKAGSQLRVDLNRQLDGRKLPVGKNVVTEGYHLPNRYIFHTVGPMIWKTPVSKMNQDLLASCYWSVLLAAIDLEIDTLAFCSISTGEFRFPKELACEIAVKTVQQVLDESGSQIKVIFNVFSNEDKQLYQEKLAIK